MEVSLLLAWYHPPFKGIKITASGELLFRLRWLPEDDTIYLFRISVSLRIYVRPFLVAARSGFYYALYITVLSPLYVFSIFFVDKVFPINPKSIRYMVRLFQ